MITARWAAALVAVIATVCAVHAPTNPVSISLAGVFIAMFTVTLWPVRKGSPDVET